MIGGLVSATSAPRPPAGRVRQPFPAPSYGCCSRPDSAGTSGAGQAREDWLTVVQLPSYAPTSQRGRGKLVSPNSPTPFSARPGSPSTSNRRRPWRFSLCK
jgi:hypothetical protein